MISPYLIEAVYFLFAELSLLNKDVFVTSDFSFVFCVPCLDVLQKGLWQEVFKNPDLQSLSARLQRTNFSARAPATVSMYDRAFRRWKEFALSKHELSYLPANPMHVAVYLQYALESTRSSSSVDTAFYSISGHTNQLVLYPLQIIL